MDTELTQLISTIGFPMAVATYMIIKNEKALKFYLNSGFEEREKKMEIKI